MELRRRYLIAGGAVLAIAAGGVGIAAATGGIGGDDGDETVSGPAADKASAAALRITHGGTANAVERDGEDGGTWEVEVTKPDGTTVDVRLDESYGLLTVDGDSEQADQGESEAGGNESNDAEEPGDAGEANGQGENG